VEKAFPLQTQQLQLVKQSRVSVQSRTPRVKQNAIVYNIPEEAAWEIALNSPEGGSDFGMLETPKFFEVNVNFTPIHDFAPQLGTTVQTAFITPQSSNQRWKCLFRGIIRKQFQTPALLIQVETSHMYGEPLQIPHSLIVLQLLTYNNFQAN